MIERGEVGGPVSVAASGRGGQVQAGVLRLSHDTFSGGLAGLIAGLLVLGLGSRLAMRASALLSPESRGILTENGNVVGAITLTGTLELVIFVGLFGGLLCGTLWVLMRDWLPLNPRSRIALAGLLAAMVGSSAVISNDNEDFHKLAAPAANITIFAIIVSLAGAATAALDPLINRALPSGLVANTIFGVLVALVGFMMLAFLLQVFFFNPEEGMSSYAGPFVVMTGIATLVGWKRYFSGRETPAGGNGNLRALAVLGIAGAAAAGAIDLIVEINGII